MGDDGSIDYTVHEAWNEATNVYLIVILVSFGLFMYAKRNKRKIMRIFSVPPTAETLSEPNFYDTISKIRLRQQLEMYSICVFSFADQREMKWFAKQVLSEGFCKALGGAQRKPAWTSAARGWESGNNTSPAEHLDRIGGCFW
ncbi:small integral membrane protein 19 [Echinops telfairi]|uniref:Small integral membrane protein 19 n=1 Tax=Echinops telfairi TaxID=9371 RepID=A0AC55CT31_ECHTE|nr:small integral membrane protein 19 [Echinops telfairi]